MPRVILTLATVAIAIYALMDCVNTEESKVRTVPKLVWVLVIVFLPWLGPLAWFVAGRSKASSPARPQRRPVAPDDDPEFLAQLDRENRERRRQNLGSAGAAPAPADDSTIVPERGPRDYSPTEMDRPEQRSTGDIDDPDEDDGARI